MNRLAAVDESSVPLGEGAVAQALRRAGVYRVLGAAFAYPTAPRLEELARASATLAMTASGLSAGAFPVRGRPAAPQADDDARGNTLGEALAAVAAAAFQADAAGVGDEHVFLFDRQARCPCWESAWSDAPQMAGAGAALADIAGFYAAFGLEPGGQPVTEDHLAAELEFMSALALKEAWAHGTADDAGVEITRSAARAFLTDHLGRWTEIFATELEAATPVPFYVAAARLLREWIREETAVLGATPTHVGRRAGTDPLQDDTFTCPMASPETGPDSTLGANDPDVAGGPPPD